MKVMMFGVDGGRQTHVHCERYIHLLQLAGCEVTFVEYRGVEVPDIPNVTYRRYPRRYQGLQKMGFSLSRVGSALLPTAAPSTPPLTALGVDERSPCAIGGRYPYQTTNILKRLGRQTIYSLRKQSLRSLWRAVRPDICHVQWVDENFCHVARAGLRPLVVTAWGGDLNSVAKMPTDDPLRQKVVAALRMIDHLIVDSDEMAATAEQLAGKDLSKTLLPIGVDTERFRPDLYQQRKEWREKLRIDPNAIVLISPRRLHADYRQSEIIRAFAALDRVDQKQTYLIIRDFFLHGIGGVSTELHRLAERLNVLDQIRWIEEVEYTQLPGLYAASDIAINFPIIDAFPVTFLECFACGLPVVSNRLPSYNSSGASTYLFFVEGDSVCGLKTAIEAAIERLGQLQTLTTEARRYVVQNFDERVSAGILRHTYEAILGRDGKVDTTRRTPRPRT
jgi:glycosyltransferase involved in cell wall biosynthesis